MLTKKQLTELKSFMPNYESELSIKHQQQLDIIKMQYLPNGRLTKLKVVTTSYIELIDTVLRLDEEGYKVNALASAQSRNGIPFVIIADLNEAQIVNARDADLSKSEQTHANEIEALEKSWLDNELADLITKEEAKLATEIKSATASKKNELLKALFS